MTVTVEVPEEMATRIQQQGESVPDYLVHAAEKALQSLSVASGKRHGLGGPLPSTSVAERSAILLQMLKAAQGRTLGQSIRSAIDEGRRR